MRNNIGIFNSRHFINGFTRDLRSQLFPRFSTTELSDESTAILNAAKRQVATYHEQESLPVNTAPTREQVIELLDDIRREEVLYPSSLLSARREQFVAQIKNACPVAAGQAGS